MVVPKYSTANLEVRTHVEGRRLSWSEEEDCEAWPGTNLGREQDTQASLEAVADNTAIDILEEGEATMI